MSKVWKTIQKVTYAISGFSMFAVIILIFINSLCRYIFKYSIPWCEEMTRFMFIATIFFTLNIMVANKAALRVDILDNLLHGTAKFILERIIALLTLAGTGGLHAQWYLSGAGGQPVCQPQPADPHVLCLRTAAFGIFPGAD